MKITGILVCIAVFLYLGDVVISISPFSIKLPNWRIPVGYFFIVLGMAYVINHHKRIAKREGKKEGIQFQVDEVLEERARQQKECAKIIDLNKVMEQRKEIHDDRVNTVTSLSKTLEYELRQWKPKQN